MTRSDDTLGREARRETKKPENRPNGQSGVDPAENGDSRRLAATERSRGVPAPPSEPEMGSTDSSGGAHGVGSSCGLVTSLFPNSCRGRAESFARRLHRRLTSLGGEGNSAEEEPRSGSTRATETSWLHGPSSQRTSTGAPADSATSLSSSARVEDRVLDSQPHRSPESDIYYDFDLDPDEHRDSDGSTMSPAEMANPADLASILVNPGILRSSHHEACHCFPGGPRPPETDGRDPESGCVFSSPVAGTSPETEDSELYFDPESSETEKSRAESFLEARGASSESEARPANGLGVKVTGLPGRGRDREKPPEDSSESSGSASYPGAPGAPEDARPTGLPTTCSSEESLNGKSSLETTSPSHESLWSTFDESTVSLPEESLSGSSCASVAARTRLSESRSESGSDSEITGSPAALVVDEVDEVDEVDLVEPEAPRKEAFASNGDVGDTESLDSEDTVHSIGVDVPGFPVLESPSGRRVATSDESLRNEVDLRMGSPKGEEDRLPERLTRGPSLEAREPEGVEDAGDEERKRDDEEASQDVEEAKEDEEEEEEEEAEEEAEAEEEEEEEEEDRPQRVRRCSSLKTGKTPPGTPGRKKIVRFADVLGLDLADVRTFLDEIPKIPNSAYSDLIYDEVFQKDSSPVNFRGASAAFATPLYAATMSKGPMLGAKPDRTLVPLFQQPGGLSTFLDLVRERQVCLENVVVDDPLTVCLHGTVRVRNLDFHKSVHVRYSLDSWRNFSDLQAVYASNSCDGFSDKFTFVLYCHTLKVGQRLEMAVRFQCRGSQYWDNNGGVNYCFQCLPATMANPGYLPITAPSMNSGARGNRDWSPTFY